MKKTASKKSLADKSIEQLHESIESFEALFNCVVDSIVVINEAGIYRKASTRQLKNRSVIHRWTKPLSR